MSLISRYLHVLVSIYCGTETKTVDQHLFYKMSVFKFQASPLKWTPVKRINQFKRNKIRKRKNKR